MTPLGVEVTIADKRCQTETDIQSGRLHADPHLHADRCAKGVQVDDTTELRWVAEGPLPTDVVEWFTRGGTRGVVEQRCDTYRMDGRRHQGVKLRFRETPELKVLQAVGKHLVLESGPAGRLQTWRRWSPAEGVEDIDGEVPWLDVCKVVTKRRFSIDGDEIVSTDLEQTTPGAGCDVEVVDITFGDIEAWTFAFAAYGPTAFREHAIVTAWQSLTADGSHPQSLATTFGPSNSYPEWLAPMASQNETTSAPAVAAT